MASSKKLPAPQSPPTERQEQDNPSTSALLLTTQVMLDDTGQPLSITTKCQAETPQGETRVLLVQDGPSTGTGAARQPQLPSPAVAPRLATPLPTSVKLIEHHDGILPVHPEQRRPASIQVIEEYPPPPQPPTSPDPQPTPPNTETSGGKPGNNGNSSPSPHSASKSKHFQDLEPLKTYATDRGQPILEAHNLSYSIGDAMLVNQVTLSLKAGEVLAIVGPNGAGKTTLLKLLTGDLPLKSGDVLLDGDSLDRIGAREQAKKRTVMRQNISMTFPFSSLEVVLMGRHPHLGPRGETTDDITIARAALEQTESLFFEHRIFTSLSVGEQARVTLARSLAQTTPVMLLDEPTAALDLRHQHITLQLARMHANAGGAVLAILHDLNLAATYADRIGIMSKGELVEIGTPWDVLEASRLEEVYRVPVVIQKHPLMAAPLVLVTP